ncbi:unnamed protein product [Symbiodinium natans]|uniref:Uncharacterized protein n=1 Tax=Symbiodinium natans TaxID=878477 RepID=A0A812UIG1_9DINO|nr:unnamed protein product [Symbiodinium natans]
MDTWSRQEAVGEGLTATSPTKSEDLLAELPPELLQGAPLHLLMRRRGAFMKPPNKCRQCVSTQQTDCYAYFVSHDWATNRWLKYFSLLVHFNGVPAAVAALIAGIGLGLLITLGLVPHSSWMPFLAHLLPVLVLLFWQDIRRVVFQARMVFLDCACIPQGDDALKAQCIRGLVSFLNRSEKLIVLWSPRYFRRIWCAYEVAFFLQKNQAEQIIFVPVQLASIWFLNYLLALLTRTTLYFSEAIDIYGQSVAAYIGLVGGVLLLQQLTIWPAVYYAVTNLLQDVEELPQQLKQFNVDDAGCSCCTNHHRDPVTGEPVPCDRKLIYEVLERWFGPGQGTEDALARFNTHMRESLVMQVEQTSRPEILILKHGVVANCAACFPYLSADIVMTCDRINRQTRGVLLYPAGQLYIFLVVLCGMRVMVLIGQFGQHSACRHRAGTIAGQVALHAAYSFGMMLLWTSWAAVIDEYSYMPLSALCILLCFSAYVLAPLCRGSCGSCLTADRARKMASRGESVGLEHVVAGVKGCDNVYSEEHVMAGPDRQVKECECDKVYNEDLVEVIV